MGLRYKSFVVPTISLFFKTKNDIDIFIEDSNDEEFYKALLNNLVGDKKINKIISCKCKSELLSACEADQNDRQRKRIYLTDGDLELIYKNKKQLKYLFTLDRYCIENYLLDESGIIEVLHSTIVLDKDKIKRNLGYDKWLKSISQPLIELFLLYSINHEFELGLKTVSNHIGGFCKQEKGITVLDIKKIELKIQELRDNIIKIIGEDNFNEKLYERRQVWYPNVPNLITIVSAKDYLLPLLNFRFKKIKGKETFNMRWEALRLNLAKSCDLTDLKTLKNTIDSL